MSYLVPSGYGLSSWRLYASVPRRLCRDPDGKIRLVMLEVIIMVLFQVVIQLLVGREPFWQLKNFSRDSVLCFQQGK